MMLALSCFVSHIAFPYTEDRPASKIDDIRIILYWELQRALN